ncbi:flagellar assembly protein FliH [Craterilacuibacter sinensis]|uniref:Flagellar assembly protein FliH n=1 Tax=Craterilacuibacter sinensis TaxID=2686017 RepID=A0A845BMY1_9NEIS|nr:flagellar assembly protein FliH [Craterilacuibacter sinensis]MXR35811.1 flagellar assembly protein H [Craterilacuibacter sinensis]
MKSWRSFRFPPLVQGELPPAFASGDVAQVQASVADGFRQGMDAGYHEGLAAGEAAGREAGQRAGYQEGLEQGRQQALASLLALAAPLDAAAASLRHTCDDYQAFLREGVVDLVDRVARQVIRCELTLRPAQILVLVEETLAALPLVKGEVEIALNSEEYERIRELAPERASQWHLLADAKLPPGECRIRTPEIEADAGCRQRLDACLDKVRTQLATLPPDGSEMPPVALAPEALAPAATTDTASARKRAPAKAAPAVKTKLQTEAEATAAPAKRSKARSKAQAGADDAA